MQIKKSSLHKHELAQIQEIALNASLKIEQTDTHFFFPLGTLSAMPFLAGRANVVFHSDTFGGATVFFDPASRNAEITAFVFDTAFEKGGYHVEFEIDETTLVDLCTDLDLLGVNDNGYFTYKEFGSNQFGERESAKCYEELDEIVNELATYEHADIFKAYIMHHGMEQVDFCRADALEEENPKGFKEAIEAVLIESHLAEAA